MTIEGLRIIAPTDLDLHCPQELDDYLSNLPYNYPFGIINPKNGYLNVVPAQSIELATMAVRKAQEARGTVNWHASLLRKVFTEKPEEFDKLSPEQRAKAIELMSRLATSESESIGPEV